jgi:hypothetical protein
MVLNMFATAFVIGLTFINSMYGLFSGMINLFCTLTAMCVSFGYYEPLNAWVIQQFGLHPSFTEPACFVLLFAITAGALRGLADLYIRGNVTVPTAVDWGGASLCGFIIAQITVGIMVLGFLMLPWGGSVAMFSRIERDPDERTDPETERARFVENGLWFGSDAMTMWLFNMISNGSMRSATQFEQVYPDFPEWVFWTGNTVQFESLTSPLRDDDGDGFENGLRVIKWWDQEQLPTAAQTEYRVKPPSREHKRPEIKNIDYRFSREHDRDYKLIGVRLELNRSAADRGSERAPASHRFRPTQIRIVGDLEQPGGTLEPVQYRPQIIGGPDSGNNRLLIVEPDRNFSLDAEGSTVIDAYFEVHKDFKPRFAEYRRHARAPIIGGPSEDPVPLPGASSFDSSDDDDDDNDGRTGRSPQAQGAARFIDAVDLSRSGDREGRLPFALSSSALRRQPNTEVRGDTITEAGIHGYRDQLTQGSTDVERLDVPSGQRLIEIAVQARRANSVLGQAMNFAGSITNQYRAVGADGREYPLCGYYGIAERDGQAYFELFYTSSPASSGFRGSLNWDWDRMRHALRDQDDAVIGLLFLVPPGTEIKSVSAGRAGGIDFGDYGFTAGR